MGLARLVYTLSTDVVKWLGVGCGRGVRGEAEVGSIWSGWVARGDLGEAARVGCCWVRLLRQAQDSPLRQAQGRWPSNEGRRRKRGVTGSGRGAACVFGRPTQPTVKQISGPDLRPEAARLSTDVMRHASSYRQNANPASALVYRDQGTGAQVGLKTWRGGLRAPPAARRRRRGPG